jgi:hypothetical protein
MMRELLQANGVTEPAHSFEKMYNQALESLGAQAVLSENNDEIFAVIIDEVDHISKSIRLLETLRDLSDMLEMPFLLVGMGRVRGNLTRFPQIASRIGQIIEFEPASLADVHALAEGLCEVKVADDLLEHLHKRSRGLHREIKEALNNIERFGKANGGGEVTLEAMTGQVLLNDRKTGSPITVRG